MTAAMCALRWEGRLRLDADAPIPRPRQGEALIRVRMAGICNTDLEIIQGYKGFQGVLGHEFVGEVVESEERGWRGQRVCGEINVGCGMCSLCRSGLQGHCNRRAVLGILGRDGAFAEYVTLPLRNLHPVPDLVPDKEAVFVEPLAAAYEILEQIALGPADHAVVLGDGKLGLLCAQVVAGTGAEVTVVGRHPEKLALAAGCGVRTALVGSDLPADADVVVEATGSASGVEIAAAMARPRGVIVLKSTVANPAPVDLSPIVVKELTVLGSRCGPFDRAIAALAHGDVVVAPLIESRYPLSQACTAMEHAASPGTLKILLDMLPLS